ncbi:hypothetical protein A2U01_0075183, partial [Trifolium medium]|nr:hypothetical protein [Trifolium medium]
MDNLEQENQALREKVSSIEAEMERMTSMMSALMAAHSQS